MPQEGLKFCPFCGATLKDVAHTVRYDSDFGSVSLSYGDADFYPEVRDEINTLLSELDKMRPAIVRHKYDASKDYWDELSSLVGMDSVKNQLRNHIIDYNVQIVRKRNHPDLQIISPFNCIFKGRPGTGKTTVARIVAGVLKEEGIIEKGCCVEMDASSITSGWVGFSSKFARLAALESLGGVLFIDESYSLLNAKGSNGSPGKEVIDTLTPLMENYRDKLIVIFAGYDKEMDEFLEQTNPGFASRFKNDIHFDDYNSEDMLHIFLKFSEENYYRITEAARARLFALLQIIESHKNRNKRFANARTVRSLFETIRSRASSRMANDRKADYDLLTLDDIAVPLEDLKSIGAI